MSVSSMHTHFIRHRPLITESQLPFGSWLKQMLGLACLVGAVMMPPIVLQINEIPRPPCCGESPRLVQEVLDEREMQFPLWECEDADSGARVRALAGGGAVRAPAWGLSAAPSPGAYSLSLLAQRE